MSATIPKTNGRARGPRVPPVAPVPEPTPEAPAAQPRPSTPSLDAAVLRVQGQAPQLSRNAVGQVQSRTYGYVTLDAIVDAVLPLLVAEELLWKVFLTSADGQPALRYRMTHVPTGESDEDTMPLLLSSADMQGLGSATTYGRRYALVAYLQLTVDPDDDGAAASQPAATSQATSQSAPAAPQPTARPRQAGPRPINEEQLALLRTMAKERGLTPVQFANALLIAKGDQARDTTDEAAAQRFLDRELGRFPGACMEAFMEEIKKLGAKQSGGKS